MKHGTKTAAQAAADDSSAQSVTIDKIQHI